MSRSLNLRHLAYNALACVVIVAVLQFVANDALRMLVAFAAGYLSVSLFPILEYDHLPRGEEERP
jgi:hypothetical protein